MAGDDNKAEEIESDDHIKIVLTKSVHAHGEDITVLKIRRPTAMDLIRMGSPVILNPLVEPPVLTHDWKKLAEILADLASVPSSAIARMDIKDLQECAWALVPFFTPRL